MVGTTEAQAATLTESWLHDTLEQLISQIRALLDVTGRRLRDHRRRPRRDPPGGRVVRVRGGVARVHAAAQRPYDPTRAGVTEAAVESGTAVLIPSVGEWPGAEGLRARLVDHLDAPLAELAWDFYRTASFISCPVRTPGGRTFGVLAISSNPPLRAAQRRGPALDRGVRAPRRAGARALRAARARGRPAPRGGARQPGAAGRRRLDRPRGRLRRDRRAGGASCRAPRRCC